MGAEDWRVDPDLEGILREVAADPRATLLRIARPQAIRAVFESSIVARESVTGLLAAERELLRAHREELARLLRRACVMLIFESPQGRMYTVRQVTATYRHDPPTRERWLGEARSEIAIAKPDIAHELCALLERCVGDVASRRATISQLAAASSRLQPTAQADIYRGEELQFEEDHAEAMRVFEAVIVKCASSTLAACAWTNLGRSRSALGDYRSALALQHRAIALDESRAAPWLNLLATATLLGDRTDIEHAAREVDCRWSGDDPVIDGFAEFHSRAALGGLAGVRNGPTPRVDHSQLGPASRRIVYAVQ